MAEGVGFGPTVGFPLLLISGQVPLTTRATLPPGALVCSAIARAASIRYYSNYGYINRQELSAPNGITRLLVACDPVTSDHNPSKASAARKRQPM